MIFPLVFELALVYYLSLAMSLYLYVHVHAHTTLTDLSGEPADVMAGAAATHASCSIYRAKTSHLCELIGDMAIY